MDVRTAFLNGKLSENVYMRQPPEFETGKKVCKLNKSLYGLKQAPRSGNDRFNAFMLKIGFRRSHQDSCPYVLENGQASVYMVLYVDDIVLTSK